MVSNPGHIHNLGPLRGNIVAFFQRLKAPDRHSKTTWSAWKEVDSRCWQWVELDLLHAVVNKYVNKLTKRLTILFAFFVVAFSLIIKKYKQLWSMLKVTGQNFGDFLYSKIGKVGEKKTLICKRNPFILDQQNLKNWVSAIPISLYYYVRM